VVRRRLHPGRPHAAEHVPLRRAHERQGGEGEGGEPPLELPWGRCSTAPCPRSSPQLVRDDPSAVVLYINGKPRLFATPERGEDREEERWRGKRPWAAAPPPPFLPYTSFPHRPGEFMRLLTSHLTRLGLTAVIGDASSAITTTDFRTERLAHGNDGAARIAEFDVLKVRRRRWWL
jgi:hypothetical protein